MTAGHPCEGLSKAAIAVFEEIAVGNDDGHSPRVLRELVRNDVVEETPDGGYQASAWAHVEWCRWASREPV